VIRPLAAGNSELTVEEICFFVYISTTTSFLIYCAEMNNKLQLEHAELGNDFGGDRAFGCLRQANWIYPCSFRRRG
jgi:hypothetical protein